MEPTGPIKSVLKPAVYQGSPKPGSETTPLPAVRSIRTMKSDIAEAITEQNETAASIALAEERKREWAQAASLAAKQEEAAHAASAMAVPKPRGRFLVVFIFLILIAVAGAVAFKIFAPSAKIIDLPIIGAVNFGKAIPEMPIFVAPTVSTPQFAPAILAPQSEKRFVLGSETPEHVAAIIAVERTAGVVQGNVENLYFSEQTTPTNSNNGVLSVPVTKLFSFMDVPVPDYVTRSLDSTFMFGLLGESGSVATPFLILKTSDSDSSRAGLLSWEPSMARDIGLLFGTKISAAATPTFTDSVLARFDARILNTQSNATVAYAFADKNTIVFAGSQSALADLLARVAKK